MNPSEPGNPEVEAQRAPADSTALAASNVPAVDVAPAAAPPAAEVAPAASTVPAAVVMPAPKIVGYCRECGKALDETNVRQALGTIYCEEHRPKQEATPLSPPPPLPQQPAAVPNAGFPNANPAYPASPYTAAPYTPSYAAAPNTYTAPPYHAGQPPPLPSSSPHNAGGSPGLAFVLGMIPGVGAVYNGQYAKGLMHVVIFGFAISLTRSGYSEFEPLLGLMISCFWFYMAFEAYHTAKNRRAGLPVDEFSGVFPVHGRAARAPIGPIVLIGLGVLFLLSNLEIIDMRKLLRYWPALLIVMGVYMIYARMTVSAEGKRDGH